MSLPSAKTSCVPANLDRWADTNMNVLTATSFVASVWAVGCAVAAQMFRQTARVQGTAEPRAGAGAARGCAVRTLPLVSRVRAVGYAVAGSPR